MIEQQFQCQICFMDCKSADKFVFPDCKHSFCKPCLKELFEQNIKEQNVKPEVFCCPQCASQFDTSLLQNLISKKSFEEYQEYALKYLQVSFLDDDEIIVDCINDYCKNKFVIWKDAEYQQCPMCNKKHCRGCKLDYHDKNVITCENLQAQIRAKNEAAAYELVKKEKLPICKCPKCGIFVEKIEGCNFITCKCGQYFCFLCDIKLTQADHWEHYKDRQPFGNECRVWQDGKWINKELAKPVLIQEIKKEIEKIIIPKEDPIPTCQNCGSCDKGLTFYVLDNLIYKCKTIKCQGGYACTICKQNIQNVNSIADHLNSKFHKDKI